MYVLCVSCLFHLLFYQVFCCVPRGAPGLKMFDVTDSSVNWFVHNMFAPLCTLC